MTGKMFGLFINGKKIGEVEAISETKLSYELQIEQLKWDLFDAIQSEEYERAIKIRDEISILEKNDI